MRALQLPGFLLLGALCVVGQQPAQQQEKTQQQTGQTGRTNQSQQSTAQQPAPTPEQVLSQSRDNDSGTAGKIKEIQGGQKIVIAVDNALDKSYSLTDAKRKITLAEGLVIGDRVRVLESDASVQIVRDMSTTMSGDQQRSRTPEQGTATQSKTGESIRQTGTATQGTTTEGAKQGSGTQSEKRNQD